MTSALACTKCNTPVPPEFVNADEWLECRACSSALKLEIFPAFFRPIQKGSVGEALLIDTQASCYYHPQKQAAVVCGGCGRYICSLCDVEYESQHLCAPCLETSQKKGKIKSLESRRVLNDTIALHISLLSFLIFYLSFIGAPIALYWAIKHWKSPTSILHQNKIRNILAISLASIQLLIWIGIIVAIFWR
jgi:hypothetical protein